MRIQASYDAGLPTINANRPDRRRAFAEEHVGDLPSIGRYRWVVRISIRYRRIRQTLVQPGRQVADGDVACVCGVPVDEREEFAIGRRRAFHIHIVADPHLTHDYVRVGFSRLGAELGKMFSRFEQSLWLIPIFPDDALIDCSCLGITEPSIAVRDPKERFHSDDAIASARDQVVLLNRTLQITFDFFLVLRGFELRLDRPRRLCQSEHRRGNSECQRERDESLHRASSDEGRRRSSELNRSTVTCLSRLRRRTGNPARAAQRGSADVPDPARFSCAGSSPDCRPRDRSRAYLSPTPRRAVGCA